ncbi:cobalamin-binding protein [Alteromonas aestuariivivens]|uniref:Cobalamin-binding protein n=1 Tax=Alteromonas aestuariivivens TaxID=1938339 RepID=A0A3D8MEK0_9ALTE|nr:cobalamin-binding protein [Alteromonas aestuariivivens]RDV28981.1 cobalamin-binding protein [Alteromonas aestuariivivens]
MKYLAGCMVLFCFCIQAEPQRIITLSPHLTEWVYSLGLQERLVAVSAHSNYPPEAQSLPIVADYNGADIAAIVALEPDLILAWQGGNKPQDISRLSTLGYKLYLSSPHRPEDIARELDEVSQLLGTSAQSRSLTDDFLKQLQALRQRYHREAPLDAFYYLWSHPLMTVGEQAWANQLLKVCGAQSLFSDSAVDYPQVSVQQVLRRQPDVLIAASQANKKSLETFWQPHRQVLSAPLIVTDPDKLSRYTLRLLPALSTLCDQLHNHASQP